MSPSDQGKKKSYTPMIPCGDRRKRTEAESYEVVAQQIMKVVVESSLVKPHDDEQSKETIAMTVVVGQT